MDDKQVTIVISDLHIGGGPADKGDDHIYQKQELVRFVRTLADSPEGTKGAIELFINGDFLEFAQADQAAFSFDSNDFWCSEEESKRKVQTIIAGHTDIFNELAALQKTGNIVTLAAGNHDVDIYWPAVQAHLREVAGDGIRFELGKEWSSRYGGKLLIGHGHLHDPANTFKNWENPIRRANSGQLRLEMCPGTLFMVKFVNKLEAKYPFADNLLPVTKLASVLLREDKLSLMAVGWMFARFSASSPSALGVKEADEIGMRLHTRFRENSAACDQLEAVLEKAGLALEYPRVDLPQLSEKRLAKLMFRLLSCIDEREWEAMFGVPRAPTIGAAEDVTLAAIVKANFDDGKMKLQDVAQGKIDSGAEVVVMGHTHQPDEVHFVDGGHYYNPGCWTRYLELKPGQKITMQDLADESKYPYQLNYVRIERTYSGSILHRKVCFEYG